MYLNISVNEHPKFRAILWIDYVMGDLKEIIAPKICKCGYEFKAHVWIISEAPCQEFISQIIYKCIYTNCDSLVWPKINEFNGQAFIFPRNKYAHIF